MTLLGAIVLSTVLGPAIIAWPSLRRASRTVVTATAGSVLLVAFSATAFVIVFALARRYGIGEISMVLIHASLVWGSLGVQVYRAWSAPRT